MQTLQATNVTDWKSLVAEHGMTAEEIKEYESLPILPVTPESEIRAWSSDEDQG